MDYASSLLGLLPGGRRTPGLKDLLSKVGSYLPPEQVERVRAAAEFGASAHQGQKRLSGEPYIAHPVAAADILAELHLDADTLIAAILHDVIEDTPTPKDEIAARFGDDVAEIVDGVTKLDQIKFKSREEAQAESLPQDAAGDGARPARDPGQARRPHAQHAHHRRGGAGQAPPGVARETLDIYAPIAERLGLYTIKLELEELGLQDALPAALPRDRARAEARARQPEGIPRPRSRSS